MKRIIWFGVTLLLIGGVGGCFIQRSIDNAIEKRQELKTRTIRESDGYTSHDHIIIRDDWENSWRQNQPNPSASEPATTD